MVPYRWNLHNIFRLRKYTVGNYIRKCTKCIKSVDYKRTSVDEKEDKS